MASINAKIAALKVSETIGKGEKVILGDILLESGYSKQTSKSPKMVTSTKTFQKTMATTLELLTSEIDKLQTEMRGRDITEERYETLSKVFDTMVKNKQLLSGGDTERVSFSLELSEDIAKKNKIE